MGVNSAYGGRAGKKWNPTDVIKDHGCRAHGRTRHDCAGQLHVAQQQHGRGEPSGVQRNAHESGYANSLSPSASVVFDDIRGYVLLVWRGGSRADGACLLLVISPA